MGSQLPYRLSNQSDVSFNECGSLESSRRRRIEDRTHGSRYIDHSPVEFPSREQLLRAEFTFQALPRLV